MDDKSNSIFLLVHGAWHTSDVWDLLRPFLGTRGYKSHTIDLPSVNAPVDFQGLRADVEAIENTILSLLDVHDNVIVVMHSYAGIPGSQATGDIVSSHKSDISGTLRFQDRIRLVYLAAYVPLVGQSNQDVIRNGPDIPMPSHLKFDGPYCYTNHDASEIFYHDVPEPLRTHCSTSLAKNFVHTSVFTTPVSQVAWDVLPSTYIHTRHDRAIPLVAQEHQVKEAQNIKPAAFSGPTGIYNLNTGHAVFFM